jgi:hypothetical protein
MRVRILPHAFWPSGGVGTVRPFPDVAAELAGGAAGCSRVIQGVGGPIEMVWVVFDQPVADGDRDGLYLEGEILTEHLQAIMPQQPSAWRARNGTAADSLDTD